MIRRSQQPTPGSKLAGELTAAQWVFRGDPRQAPQDLYALLELLRELVFETGDGVHSETAREFLQQLKPTTSVGKAARVLLDREAAVPASRRAEIMVAAPSSSSRRR